MIGVITRVTLFFTIATISAELAFGVAAGELPSTDKFMNVLAVCGAGSGIKIEGDLEGSVRSLYEKEKTQGHATQDIVAKVLELLPEGQRLAAYNAYLGCVDKKL